MQPNTYNTIQSKASKQQETATHQRQGKQQEHTNIYIYIHKAAAVATQAADKAKQNNQARNKRQHKDIHTDR